jgi:hypothetical protein
MEFLSKAASFHILMKNIFAKFIIIIKQRNKMAKQFVEIKCYKKSYRVFQEDLKKVFYMAKTKKPSIPSFSEN